MSFQQPPRMLATPHRRKSINVQDIKYGKQAIQHVSKRTSPKSIQSLQAHQKANFFNAQLQWLLFDSRHFYSHADAVSRKLKNLTVRQDQGSCSRSLLLSASCSRPRPSRASATSLCWFISSSGCETNSSNMRSTVASPSCGEGLFIKSWSGGGVLARRACGCSKGLSVLVSNKLGSSGPCVAERGEWWLPKGE